MYLQVRRIVWAGVLGMMFMAGLPARASEGLFLLGNDALQLGRADSGTASPRSAYWTLMNPAALVDLNKRIDVTLYTVRERIQLNPNGLLGNPFDGSLTADADLLIPTGGVVWPIQGGDKGTLGAGMYVIGGGKVEYDEARTILGKLLYRNNDRKLALEHHQLALGYGYRFDNGWAVGVGLQGSLTRFRTDQLTLTLRTADSDNEWDEAFGIGFNLGVYKRWEHWAVGAMYKSRQWSQTLDKYRDLLKTSLDYPHMGRVGVAWIPRDDLEFTLDYEYHAWSKVSPFKDRMLDSGLEWDDVHAIKFGIEWKATDKLTFMAGTSIGDTVIDDDHVFINAFVPTIIEHHYSVGATYHLNDHHSFHLVYLRSGDNKVTDSGRGDPISRLAGGSELEVSADSLAFGYSYSF